MMKGERILVARCASTKYFLFILGASTTLPFSCSLRTLRQLWNPKTGLGRNPSNKSFWPYIRNAQAN